MGYFGIICFVVLGCSVVERFSGNDQANHKHNNKVSHLLLRVSRWRCVRPVMPVSTRFINSSILLWKSTCGSLFVLMFLSGLEVTAVHLLLVGLLLLVTRVFKVFVKLFNCVATVSLELLIAVLTADARWAISTASRKVFRCFSKIVSLKSTLSPWTKQRILSASKMLIRRNFLLKSFK